MEHPNLRDVQFEMIIIKWFIAFAANHRQQIEDSLCPGLVDNTMRQ